VTQCKKNIKESILTLTFARVLYAVNTVKLDKRSCYQRRRCPEDRTY